MRGSGVRHAINCIQSFLVIIVRYRTCINSFLMFLSMPSGVCLHMNAFLVTDGRGGLFAFRQLRTDRGGGGGSENLDFGRTSFMDGPL